MPHWRFTATIFGMIIMPGVTVFGPDGAEYEVVEYVGNGSFGEVHKVKQRNGDQLLAMKTVPTPFTDTTALKAFINEGNLAVEIHIRT